MAWLGLASLSNGISNFVGYLMPKPSLKNSSGTSKSDLPLKQFYLDGGQTSNKMIMMA